MKFGVAPHYISALKYVLLKDHLEALSVVDYNSDPLDRVIVENVQKEVGESRVN